MKLLWYHDASDDLDEIYDYYVTLNPRAAALLYNSILDEAEILRTHPRIAKKEQFLEGLPTEYRSLVVAKGKYKLVYYIEKECVYIVYIFSCRLNPSTLINTILKRTTR